MMALVIEYPMTTPRGGANRTNESKHVFYLMVAYASIYNGI